MTNKEREIIIQNAIRGYKYARQTGDKRQIEIAINDMNCAYIAVCLWSVRGTDELKQLIRAAQR